LDVAVEAVDLLAEPLEKVAIEGGCAGKPPYWIATVATSPRASSSAASIVM